MLAPTHRGAHGCHSPAHLPSANPTLFLYRTAQRATVHLPDCQPAASHRYLHQVIMQHQVEEVKEKNPLFPVSHTHPCILHRLPLGEHKGEEAAAPCSSCWLVSKEFGNKWKANMWHQGASFMVGFLSIMKYTVKLTCHQDESLCLSGLSVSVFS